LKENFLMVRIRLRRTGQRGQPSYRLVIADKESPRDGRFLEIVGFYNPRTDPATLNIKEDRVFEWMSKGAQPTESVAQLFKTAGTVQRFERFKAGESVETLLAEVETANAARLHTNKTRK
jgi:small subunit ribosomal protein S16